MKYKVLLLLFGTWIFSSCKTAEPPKATTSVPANGLSNYNLTIRVRDNENGIFSKIFSKVQQITGQYNLVQIDWSSDFSEPKEIRARLGAVPERMINKICTKIYRIPNVIAVNIDKN